LQGISFILDPAVRDGKLMQDLELESLCNGVGHSQMVKDHPIANDSGSRDCVKLPSPTAGFRFILMGSEVGKTIVRNETFCPLREINDGNDVTI